MKDQQLAEVWQWLDREYLAEVAQRGPVPVFATISGAHLYGFASPDSDVDLRGAVLWPVRELLGLEPPKKETVELHAHERYELDWVAHDLRKFARLMIRHNGYVLEQLYSPLVVYTTPVHDRLKEFGRGCITRGLVRHYGGFFRSRHKRLQEPAPTLKHLLYAYRVLLTGIHALRTGRIEANLETLNEQHFELPHLAALIERKRHGAEKMPLEENGLAEHDRYLQQLHEELHQAHAKSALPDEPTTVEALNDYVVHLRLERGAAKR